MNPKDVELNKLNPKDVELNKLNPKDVELDKLNPNYVEIDNLLEVPHTPIIFELKQQETVDAKILFELITRAMYFYGDIIESIQTDVISCSNPIEQHLANAVLFESYSTIDNGFISTLELLADRSYDNNEDLSNRKFSAVDNFSMREDAYIFALHALLNTQNPIALCVVWNILYKYFF